MVQNHKTRLSAIIHANCDFFYLCIYIKYLEQIQSWLQLARFVRLTDPFNKESDLPGHRLHHDSYWVADYHHRNCYAVSKALSEVDYVATLSLDVAAPLYNL